MFREQTGNMHKRNDFNAKRKDGCDHLYFGPYMLVLWMGSVTTREE
jgi:hypothetical protein